MRLGDEDYRLPWTERTDRGGRLNLRHGRGPIGMLKVCNDDSDQRGFIIVAVLWILAALATLALIYSVYAREAALNFVGHDERLQAEALAESGVELAAYQLTAQANLQPLQGHFSFRQ